MKNKYCGFINKSFLKKKSNKLPKYFSKNGRSSFDIIIKFVNGGVDTGDLVKFKNQ